MDLLWPPYDFATGLLWPMVCLWCACGWLMLCLWVYDNSAKGLQRFSLLWVSYGIPMGLLWFCIGVALVLLWHRHGFTIVPYPFAEVSLNLPYGLLWSSYLWFPLLVCHGFPVVSFGFPMVSWFPYGFPVASPWFSYSFLQYRNCIPQMKPISNIVY